MGVLKARVGGVWEEVTGSAGGAQWPQSPDMINTLATFFDDFLGGDVTSGNIGTLGWRSASTGATISGPIALIGLEPVHGAMVFDSGTATNNHACIYLPSQHRVLQFLWQARCQPSAVVAGNQIVARFGLGSTTDGTAPANGMYFECDSGTGSTIKAVTASTTGGGAATPTVTDTGVVPASTMKKFGIVSNGSGQIEFLIDDVVEATHTVNVPGIYEAWAPFFSIIKTTGSTIARTLYVDYCYMRTVTSR